MHEWERYAAAGTEVAAEDWCWLHTQARPAMDIIDGDWGHRTKLQFGAVLAYADAHGRGKGEAAARKLARKALDGAYSFYHVYDKRSKGQRGAVDARLQGAGGHVVFMAEYPPAERIFSHARAV